MRLALALLVSLGVVPAYANALTFSGTLDGREIVAELTEPSDGAVAGRFAFTDTGSDVPLTPVSHDDGVWVLNEEAPCEEGQCQTDDNGNVIDVPLAAVWELTYDADNFVASGIRRTIGSKPKEVPVRLEVIAWRELGEGEEASATALHERSGSTYHDGALPIDWPTMPYEMLLLDVGVAVSEIEEMAGGAAQFRYFTDPRTKFAFPRAVSFAGGEPIDNVNEILRTQHYRLSLSALNCLALRYPAYGATEYNRGGTLGDFDSEQVTLTFLTPRVVSWTQGGSLWCGGAHPYNHYDTYNVDVTTGDALPLQKVFSAWVPREWGAAPDAIADADAAAANPENFSWGPNAALLAYVRENLPAEMLYDDEPELNEACYSDEALTQYLNIRFEAPLNAVFTTSGYPHVISVCGGDLFSVPLTDLWDFLAPDASDYFPELGG